MVAAYREAGIPVFASHCPSCGRWAHVDAGDDGPRKYWLVTNCKRCGRWRVSGGPIGSWWLNPRIEKEPSND